MIATAWVVAILVRCDYFSLARRLRGVSGADHLLKRDFRHLSRAIRHSDPTLKFRTGDRVMHHKSPHSLY
jgi:hypothetical protein